jgi:hypothetical protein
MGIIAWIVLGLGTGGRGAGRRLARQINDDLRPAYHDRGERSRGTGGLRHVQLPAQRDDNLAVASAGTHIHTSHQHAFLLQQQGGVLMEVTVVPACTPRCT